MLGLRGAAIGGSVEGRELSDRFFDPFWAKAEELGVLLFMHPQPAQGTTQNARLQGRGGLGNTIGNPLETTVFLSHLIFEGTFDRFPDLRICAAHAGGYLASYTGRSDALCGRGGGFGQDCRALKRRPSEYFRSNIYIDSMIFREEGLRHLDRYNPSVNAYVTVTRDEALQTARQVEAELRRGRPRGPLHGIPIALKDNIDTAGTRTTAASGVFRDRVPFEDADVFAG